MTERRGKNHHTRRVEKGERGQAPRGGQRSRKVGRMSGDKGPIEDSWGDSHIHSRDLWARDSPAVGEGSLGAQSVPLHVPLSAFIGK